MVTNMILIMNCTSCTIVQLAGTLFIICKKKNEIGGMILVIRDIYRKILFLESDLIVSRIKVKIGRFHFVSFLLFPKRISTYLIQRTSIFFKYLVRVMKIFLNIRCLHGYVFFVLKFLYLTGFK